MTTSTATDEFEAPGLTADAVMTDDERGPRRQLHGASLAVARLLAPQDTAHRHPKSQRSRAIGWNTMSVFKLR